MEQDRWSRLPVWAQEELKLLTMRLKEANTTIEHLRGKHPPTRVAIPAVAELDGQMEFRSEFTTLRVGPPDTHHTKGIHAGLARTESNVDRDYVMEVRGQDSIEVLPVASNVVHIRLRRR